MRPKAAALAHACVAALLAALARDAVEGPLAGTLTLSATGGNAAFTSQTLQFSPRIAGSHRLFLVFRSVAGGATANLGNLNWAGFTGPGAGVTP